MSPDPQALLQGLSISIAGLLITFSALGVFIFVMLILQRIFPPTHPEEADSEPEAAPESIAQIETSEEDEIIVAIATALQYLRSTQESTLGKSLESGPGPLWSAGRYSTSSSVTRIPRS